MTLANVSIIVLAGYGLLLIRVGFYGCGGGLDLLRCNGNE
jgi:hypothetical protein